MRFSRHLTVLAFSGIGVPTLLALLAGCGLETSFPRASGGHGTVQFADESNFAEFVLQAQGPVLVDFYAGWCRPCRIQAPILDDFARHTPQVTVVKVDIEQAPSLAQQYGIRGIPSRRVFREGQIVAEDTGVANLRKLKSLVGI